MSTSTNIVTVPPEQVLDLELPSNQANAATVREYLKSLLAAVWDQGPDYEPKRLLRWRAPIEEAFIGAKLIAGRLDEHGFVASRVNDREIDALIRDAIEVL